MTDEQILEDLLKKRSKAEQHLAIIRQDIQAVRVRIRAAKKAERIANGPKPQKQSMAEAEARRRSAVAMRKEGLKYPEIGRRIGVSAARARQLVIIQEWKDNPEMRTRWMDVFKS
jgi:hypothetical protein